MAFIRKFTTTSGATGVQVIYKDGARVIKTVHVGSAASERELAKLEREAQKILDGDKQPLFNLDRYNKPLPPADRGGTKAKKGMAAPEAEEENAERK